MVNVTKPSCFGWSLFWTQRADTDASRQVKRDFIEDVEDESSEGWLGAGRWQVALAQEEQKSIQAPEKNMTLEN